MLLKVCSIWSIRGALLCANGNVFFSDLLGAFNDQDLDNPTAIDFKAKERISRTSGKSIDEVSKLLVNYKQSLIVQQWLVLK